MAVPQKMPEAAVSALRFFEAFPISRHISKQHIFLVNLLLLENKSKHSHRMLSLKSIYIIIT